jgi:hypothetical protein
MDFTKMSSGYQNLLPRHHRCHQSTAVAVTGAPPSLSPECHHHRCHYRSAARHRYQVLTSVRSSYRLLHVIYWCRCHPRLLKLDATSNAWLLRSRTSTPRLTPRTSTSAGCPRRWTQQQGRPPLPALSSMIDHDQSSLVLKLTGHNNSGQ